MWRRLINSYTGGKEWKSTELDNNSNIGGKYNQKQPKWKRKTTWIIKEGFCRI